MHPSMYVDTPPGLASTVVRRFYAVLFTLPLEGVRLAIALLLDTYRQMFGAFSRSRFLFVRRLYDVFL